jgi:SAM-dependent methyltransferase
VITRDRRERRSAASLARRNKRAWDELYEKTEWPVWGRLPIGFLEEFLGLVTPPLGADSRILDAGAGDGRNTASLRATGARVWSCDSSIHALRKMRRDAGSACALCDLAALPFAGGLFDFVLLTDVIETLPEPEPALAEASRVLKPGGMLLCNIPGAADPIADREMSPIEDRGFLYRHTYFFRFVDETAAADELRRHGFAIAASGSRRWTEAPHPGFRSYEHEHVSSVFLAVKS